MKRLREVGAEIVANTPDEFAASIPSGIAKWSKVIRDAGIEAE
jgi:tripartite-type tricarboxylate transporter receptor subunit TctC